MRIAVIANIKENAPVWEGISSDQWDELDTAETVNAIVAALKNSGHDALFFEASIDPAFNLLEKLKKYKPDLCFNIAEGHFGNGREAHIPAILEMMRTPYTGSRVLTLAIALDKPMTKRLLHYHELPTPEFQVFESADESINEDLLNQSGELRFPMFVKPSREGTGRGVSPDNLVYDTSSLRELVARLLDQYRQPILCERFIRGREITVGLIGNLDPRSARRLNDRLTPAELPQELFFFPPLEIDFDAYKSQKEPIYSNQLKVELVHDFHYICPAVLESRLSEYLFSLSAAVFRIMECHDLARIDFRLDEAHHNQPYILEINPLPGLCPTYSDLPLEAYAAGWSYERLINTIVDLAARRHGLCGVREVLPKKRAIAALS